MLPLNAEPICVREAVQSPWNNVSESDVSAVIAKALSSTSAAYAESTFELCYWRRNCPLSFYVTDCCYPKENFETHR